MTSKPSNTNYPKASEWRGQSLNLTVGSFTLFFQYVMILVIHLTGSGLKMDTTILGVYSDGVPPLPIPNREVKPVSADGTAEMWESRSTPTFKKSLIPNGVRLFFIMKNYVQRIFFVIKILTISGIYSGKVPPLPIPNREVKLVSADGTAEMWESRSMPIFKRVLFHLGVRLFFYEFNSV